MAHGKPPAPRAKCRPAVHYGVGGALAAQTALLLVGGVALGRGWICSEGGAGAAGRGPATVEPAAVEPGTGSRLASPAPAQVRGVGVGARSKWSLLPRLAVLAGSTIGGGPGGDGETAFATEEGVAASKAREWRPCQGPCCSRERLQFVHIPKAAGTAIENVGEENGTRWGAKLMWHEECDNLKGVEKCSPWHLPPSWLNEPNFYMGSETFCVVRDPVDRAVSQYSYIANDPKDAGKFLHLVQQYGCAAAGLNVFLGTALRKFAVGEHWVQNCHFMLQSEYVWGPSFLWGALRKRTCDYVLKFEELPDSFNALMARKGYGARLSRQRHNKGVCNISRRDLLPEVRSLLFSVYAEDYRLLNYTIRE